MGPSIAAEGGPDLPGRVDALKDAPREGGREPSSSGGASSRLSILYVGVESGTSLHRANALRELGHDVLHVKSGIPPRRHARQRIDLLYNLFRLAHRVRPHPDVYLANWRLLRRAKRRRFDVVWIDKGLAIRGETLDELRRRLPGARLVAYSPDDMLNPTNQSPRYLASVDRYDLHVTTKSYNVSELGELGARDVLFIDCAYDPATHRAIDLSPEEQRRFGAGVGFVGYFESDRAEWMYRLAESGIPVTVRGRNWRRFGKSHPNFTSTDTFIGESEYPRIINATKINLGFLRKVNRDLQTTRSIEIPACRAFMLAERTAEHVRLFREGEEAEFFDSFEELRDKCRRYLADDEARRRIAEAGYRRCVEAGYSNEERLARVLAHLFSR